MSDPMKSCFFPIWFLAMLPLMGCEPTLRVAQATIDALQTELSEEPSWARAPVATTTSSGSLPPVQPSISQPAAGLDLSGWASPEAALPKPNAPQALTPMATGSTAPAAAQSSGDANHAWAYAGPNGPEHWGQMSPAFATCLHGKTQSPIELSSARPGALPELGINYRTSPLKIINNGHTLVFPQEPGSWISLNGARYDLLQVDVHSPSEHTLGGQTAAMELHYVHQNLHGQMAILAVMVQPGAANSLLANIAEQAPSTDNTVTPANKVFDPKALLPRNLNHIRYLGSLTTPPCTEGVAWHVLTQPIAASQSDINAIAALMPQPNTRPIQPAKDRLLVVN